MVAETCVRPIFRLFADILDYPRPGLIEAVCECEELISDEHPEAVALLRKFRTFVEESPPGRLEEVYTGTFDLDTVFHPYVGYHLFGESYKRSVFLLGLKERFREYGFEPGIELPDYLPVLLRFLAIYDDAEGAEELLQEAVLPVLDRMARKETQEEAEGADGDVPPPPPGPKVYEQAMLALWLVLKPLMRPVDAEGSGNGEPQYPAVGPMH